MLQLSSTHRQSDAPAERPARARRRAAWILAGVLLLLAVAGGVWAALQSGNERGTVRLDISSRPPPLPALKQGFIPMEPAKAEVVNAGIALSPAPLEPARPFLLPNVTLQNFTAHQSAVDCLTAAIYYEAASETVTGQRSVAQVVLNRVRHPAYPKSVCGVVYEGSERRTGCQFSFTCDGSLARTPSRTGWDRAKGIALAALAGYVEPTVGTATHYHTQWVVPYWAWSLDKVVVVGAHIFYRWKGYWGRRSAFTGVYAGEKTSEEETPLLPYLGADGLQLGEPSEMGPLGPRPLADDLGPIGAGVTSDLPPPPPLRADKEAGVLIADDAAGSATEAPPATR